MKLNDRIFKAFQRLGLSPPSINDEISTYIMLLITIGVVGGLFVLRPAYEEFQASRTEINELQTELNFIKNSVGNQAANTATLETNRQNIVDKQAPYIKTQVDSELLREIILILQARGLQPLSVELRDATNVEPFQCFTIEIHTSGVFEDLLNFIETIAADPSIKLVESSLRELDMYSNPLDSNFSANFTLMVYTVIPPAPIELEGMVE